MDQTSADRYPSGEIVSSDTRWRPGERPVGRAKGTPNKLTIKQREVAAMVLGEPGTPEFDEFVASERADWKAGTMHPGVKQMWMHYLVGKPKETVEVEGTVTVEKIVREVIRLPQDEPMTIDAIH